MATAAQCSETEVNHESEWPFPAENDGWVKAHDVVRADMADVLAALKALEQRLQGGATLQAWEKACLVKFYDVFHHNVHFHHYHEEEVFFPELKKKFELPPKMTDDHPALMKALGDCKDMVSALKPGEPCLDPVSALIEKFSDLEASMKEHLKEEEEVGLPLYRKHFTPKEGMKLVGKIMADLKMSDFGWFFHNMKPEEKEAFRKQEGLSYPFAYWVLFPQAPKYNKKYTVMLNAVKEGKEPPKKILKTLLK